MLLCPSSGLDRVNFTMLSNLKSSTSSQVFDIQWPRLEIPATLLGSKVRSFELGGYVSIKTPL
jgi:hypothetical protein